MRKATILPALLALSCSAHAQMAGLAASGLTPLPTLQHDGQTFYPNAFTLGSTDPQLANAVYNASRMAMKSGSCNATALRLGFTNSAVNQGSIGELTTAQPPRTHRMLSVSRA